MKRHLLGALLLTTACSAEPDISMVVGEVGYTAAELAGIPAEQHDLLADLAAFGLLAAEGRLADLADDLASVEVHRSRLRVLPFELAARARPESEARAAYDANPEWELTVRHIVRLVPSRADDGVRRGALEVAREAERRARAGDDFARLAGEYSEEPGAARRGGLLQPGREGTWVDEFWTTALQLEPGEVSHVVETVHGYHVIRLEARRPIPFHEAERASALRRAITRDDARMAMEAWVATRPPLVLHRDAWSAAREQISKGRLPDIDTIVTSASGGVFDGQDLALARAVLEPREREELGRANDETFARWAEDQAREEIWADEARAMGVDPDPRVAAEAPVRWRARIEQHAAALGFRPGMTPARVRASTFTALAARGQESLLARAPLPGYRPLLRARYPVRPGSD